MNWVFDGKIWYARKGHYFAVIKQQFFGNYKLKITVQYEPESKEFTVIKASGMLSQQSSKLVAEVLISTYSSME
tara:strand:- start:12144 stop:12365 length:222 start_codon:yes stop_codon:yes gene_type:complete